MKKITIQTVYYNCTDEFIEEYLESLAMNEMLKDAKEDFLKGETIGFRSDDSKSPAYGVSNYKLEDM